MVLLENVKLDELKLNSFPGFNCLCELCDDGCFDRRKQKHQSDCKRQSKKEEALSVENGPCMSTLSHYKETFSGKLTGRPATLCHPASDSDSVLVPKGEMQFSTVNKSDFKPYEMPERTKSMKKIEKYEKSEAKVNGTSSYAAEYIPKEATGFSVVKKNSNETTLKVSAGPISSSTTNKEHFQQWAAAPKLERGYSEYPSLMGLTLFPSDKRQFSTSTAEFHREFAVTPRLATKSSRPDYTGSLKVEGDMSLHTNYRDTFVKYQNAEKMKPIVPKTSMLTEYESNRPFLSKSQTSVDFVRYPSYKVSKPAAGNTFVSFIGDDLYPGPKIEHSTIYSTQFAKIDPKLIERAKSCKKANPVYEAPEVKIESETVTKRDFRPIDIKSVPVLKAKKIEANLKMNVGPMETKTMSMLQFIPYEVKRVQLAKDPHPPTPYNPIKTKFADETTTKSAFTGEIGEKPQRFKPKTATLQVEKDVSMSVNTHYRDNFVSHGLTLCQSKAYLIAKSLDEGLIRK